MAILACGLIKPSLPGSGPHRAHGAVAVLALDEIGAVGGRGAAHGAAQTAGKGARMAAVAGRAVGGCIHVRARCGIGDLGLLPVHGRRQRGHAGGDGNWKRVGGGAFIAKDWLAILHDIGVESGKMVARRLKGLGVERTPQMAVIVQFQDVQAVVPLGVGVVHPAGRRLRRRAAAGGMAGRAGHLIRDGQNNGCGGHHIVSGVPHRDLHQGIGVAPARVIGGGEGSPFGEKPGIGCVKSQRLGRV